MKVSWKHTHTHTQKHTQGQAHSFSSPSLQTHSDKHGVRLAGRRDADGLTDVESVQVTKRGVTRRDPSSANGRAGTDKPLMRHRGGH